MPNIEISDLPSATLPLSPLQSFFEVQTVESGEDVSRKISANDISINLPDGTVLGSIMVLSAVIDTYINNEQVIADGVNVLLNTTQVIADGTNVFLRDTTHAAAGANLSTFLEGISVATELAAADNTVTALRGGVRLQDLDGVTTLAALDFQNAVSAGALLLRNATEGGFISLRGTATAGAFGDRTVFEGDPDGASTMFNLGVARALTTASGMTINAGASLGLVTLFATANVASFYSQYNGFNGGVAIKNQNPGARLVQISTGGGEEDVWIEMVRDGLVGLNHNNVAMARTVVIASGGLEVNNTVTGAGFERVLTTADIFGGALNDLSDVVITAAASFDTFFFNGSEWADSAMLQITGTGATMGGATLGITGISVRGRFTNAGESGGSTQTRVLFADDDGSVVFGEIEYNTTGGGVDGDAMYFRNRRHGGNIEFEGENDIGTLVPMLGFDPQTVINTLHTDIVIDGGTTRLIEIFPTGGARFQIEQVAGGADPTTFGYTGGQPQLSMTDSAIVTLGNIATTSGQTIIGGGLNDRVDIFADTTNNFRLQWTGADWAVESRVNGAELILRARDGGGTMIDMLVMDASGNTRLRQGTNNLDVLITRVGGFRTIGNTANTPATGGTQVNFFDWENNAGDIAATMGFNTSIDWRFYNQVHAGSILFDGENTAGTLRNLVAMDPDDDIKLFDSGTEVFRTLPVASGGAEADNQLTGVGFRRVLTEGDALTDEVVSDIAIPGVAFVTGLSIRGEINRTYAITGFLMTSVALDADDSSTRIRGPAGMTAIIQLNGIANGVVTFRVTELQATLMDEPGGGIISSVFISGSVIMGGTAGSVTIEVAKQADAGGDGTIHLSSWLKMVPVPSAP